MVTGMSQYALVRKKRILHCCWERFVMIQKQCSVVYLW